MSDSGCGMDWLVHRALDSLLVGSCPIPLVVEDCMLFAVTVACAWLLPCAVTCLLSWCSGGGLQEWGRVVLLPVD